jgi:hypothetical protein
MPGQLTCLRTKSDVGSRSYSFKSSTSDAIQWVYLLKKAEGKEAITSVISPTKVDNPEPHPEVTIKCPAGWRAGKILSDSKRMVVMLSFDGPKTELKKGTKAISFTIVGPEDLIEFDCFMASAFNPRTPFKSQNQISGEIRIGP